MRGALISNNLLIIYLRGNQHPLNENFIVRSDIFL